LRRIASRAERMDGPNPGGASLDSAPRTLVSRAAMELRPRSRHEYCPREPGISGGSRPRLRRMASETDVRDSVPKQLWIGGPVDATGGGRFGGPNPATGEVIAEVADATPEDAVRALDAAVAAQADWAATPARERGEILRAVFERITARAEDFALLMTLEMGK